MATIDAAGLATTHIEGNATIKAALGGVSKSVALTVDPAALMGIMLMPLVPRIFKGQTQAFIAMGMYTDDSMLDLTDQVAWASSAPAVATIDAAGLATGVGVGNSIITATLGDMSGTTILTVKPSSLVSISIQPTDPILPKGRTLQFAAIGHFADGTTQDVTGQVTWSSPTPALTAIGADRPGERARAGPRHHHGRARRVHGLDDAQRLVGHARLDRRLGRVAEPHDRRHRGVHGDGPVHRRLDPGRQPVRRLGVFGPRRRDRLAGGRGLRDRRGGRDDHRHDRQPRRLRRPLGQAGLAGLPRHQPRGPRRAGGPDPGVRGDRHVFRQDDEGPHLGRHLVVVLDRRRHDLAFRRGERASAGTTTITATLGGVSASTALSVAGSTIPPNPLFVATGATQGEEGAEGLGHGRQLQGPENRRLRLPGHHRLGRRHRTTIGKIRRTGNGRYAVAGSHAYASAGTFAVRVTIRDRQGRAITAQDSVKATR